MEFRALTIRDIPSLLALYPQLGDAPLPDISRAEAVWEQAARAGVTYFGAVDGGRVVSTCYLCVIPNLTHNAAPVGFIENVATDAAYRRQGLGRRVLQMAIAHAKAAGCHNILLASGSRRANEAHPFYESLGFDGERKRAFYMNLDD